MTKDARDYSLARLADDDFEEGHAPPILPTRRPPRPSTTADPLELPPPHASTPYQDLKTTSASPSPPTTMLADPRHTITMRIDGKETCFRLRDLVMSNGSAIRPEIITGLRLTSEEQHEIMAAFNRMRGLFPPGSHRSAPPSTSSTSHTTTPSSSVPTTKPAVAVGSSAGPATGSDRRKLEVYRTALLEVMEPVINQGLLPVHVLKLLAGELVKEREQWESSTLNSTHLVALLEHVLNSTEDDENEVA
jgi:hypothetical protein